MKKILVLLASLILFCGCNEKKNDDNISEEVTTNAETDETPDTGDTIVETGFREYNESDFNKISVTFSYPDKDSPVEMECITLPEYDFGERLASCKESDELWKYFGGQPQNERPSDPDNIMNKPEKGRVKQVYKKDNILYMIVSYDNVCTYCHEWAVFCYDLQTKEMKEVYTAPSDVNRNYAKLRNTFIIGNKLVASYFDDNEEVSVMHTELIDLESGESKEICTNDGAATNLFSNGKDKLVFLKNDYSDAQNSKGFIAEYNLETSTSADITEKETENIENLCVSDITGYIARDAKANKWNLITEHYRLNTDLIGARVVYLSDKKAVLVETSVDKVHTFDFEKKEHYVTRLKNEMSTVYSYDGNLVFCKADGNNDQIRSSDFYGHSGDFYYLIPELGVAYKFAEGITASEPERYVDDMEFYGLEADSIQLDAEQTLSTNKIASLCILKNKEQ